jgi:hypothetical protein
MQMPVRICGFIASSLALASLAAPAVRGETVLSGGASTVRIWDQDELSAASSWDGSADRVGQSGRFSFDNGFEVSYRIVYVAGVLTYQHSISGGRAIDPGKPSGFNLDGQVLHGAPPPGELRYGYSSGLPSVAGWTSDPRIAAIQIITDHGPMRGAVNARVDDDPAAWSGAGLLVPDTEPASMQVVVVPVPSAAWAGAALLAGMGIVRLRRRPMAAAEG